FLLWAERKSSHPMSAERKRILLILRTLGIILALVALAGPAQVTTSTKQAVVLLLDQSHSLGDEGSKAAVAKLLAIKASLPAGVEVSQVAFGDEARLLQDEQLSAGNNDAMDSWRQKHGGQSAYAAALEYARALFPAGTARHVVFI